MTDQTLLPCPFCGEQRLNICATRFEPEDREAFAVTCRNRDCHGVIFTLGYGQFESREKAIEAWNTRSTPHQQRKVINEKTKAKKA